MKTRTTPKGQTQYRVNGQWMPLGWKPGMAAPTPRPNEAAHKVSEAVAEMEQSDDEIVNDARSETK